MKAVIFDLDGTLVDTKKIHIDAWLDVFARHGFRLSRDDVNSFFGVYDVDIFRIFFKEHSIDDSAERWSAERRRMTVGKMRDARLFPGAKSLLACIPSDVKVALGTSSSRQEVDAVFGKNGLRRFFDVIVSREGVCHRKPHPELYLKIARKLNVRPRDCVVVEDSVAGVEAAKRAGMFCIAVLFSYPPSKLKKADVRVRSLRSKTIRRLLCRS